MGGCAGVDGHVGMGAWEGTRWASAACLRVVL